jgi:hypothetical protein
MASLPTGSDRSKRLSICATVAIAVAAVAIVGLASHVEGRNSALGASSGVAAAPVNLTGQTGMVVR